jgi:hypothetical protein
MSTRSRSRSEYRPSFSPFALDCFYLDYNGERFVPIHHSFEISDFEGDQAVKSLPVLPMVVAERDPGLIDKQAILNRGRQFVQCTEKVSHLEFSGRSHYLTPNGKRLIGLTDGIARSALCYSERIEGEVMVDFPRALQAVPSWRPEPTERQLHMTTSEEIGDDRGIDEDGRWDDKLSVELMEKEERKWRAWEKGRGAPSQDDDLLLLPDRVFAFVLSSRRWGTCLPRSFYAKRES